MSVSSLHRSQIFQLALGAVLSGLAIGILLNPGLIKIVSLAIACLGVMILSLGWQRKAALVIALLLIGVSLGLWRGAVKHETGQHSVMASYNDQAAISWQGVIVEEPDIRDTKTHYTVAATTVEGRELRGKAGRVLVTLGRYPQYHYGDLLEFKGKIETPFETEDFSYRNYLAKDGIYSVAQYPRTEIIARGQGSSIKAWLLAAKQYFASTLAAILPEPHNSLLLGLLLGLKRSLPADLVDQLKATGLTHIVAISGFNISIITRILGEAFRRWFGRLPAFALTFLGLIAFVIITGATASVIRAAVMGIVVLLAMNIGRLSGMGGALLLAASGMAWMSPMILFFDLGFQLSFLATLGLIFFSEFFETLLHSVPDFLELRTTLAATLSAQLFVWPILIYNFDQLSIISPLANILVLPLIPPLMLIGFVTGVVTIVNSTLALIPGWITWGLLQYMLYAIYILARVPFGSLTIGHPALPWILSYYLILLLASSIVLLRRRALRVREFYQYGSERAA